MWFGNVTRRKESYNVTQVVQEPGDDIDGYGLITSKCAAANPWIISSASPKTDP